MKENLEILATEMRASRGQGKQRAINPTAGENSSRRTTSSDSHSRSSDTSDTDSADDLTTSLLEVDNAIGGSRPPNDAGPSNFSAGAMVNYGAQVLNIALSASALYATGRLNARLEDADARKDMETWKRDRVVEYRLSKKIVSDYLKVKFGDNDFHVKVRTVTTNASICFDQADRH